MQYQLLLLQIKKCDYSVLYNDGLLIDRIVFGINNNELRVKLFIVENLTIDKVIQMCMGGEKSINVSKCEKDTEIIEKETFTIKRNCNAINNTRNYVKLDSTEKLESSRYKTIHKNKKSHASNINHNKCILVRNTEKSVKVRSDKII